MTKRDKEKYLARIRKAIRAINHDHREELKVVRMAIAWIKKGNLARARAHMYSLSYQIDDENWGDL